MSDKQAAAMLDKKLGKIPVQDRCGTGNIDGTENAARRALALARIIDYTSSESEGLPCR